MSSSTASRLEALAGLASAKRLVLRLAKGQIGVHAVLFYGVPGSGKHTLAALLAQAWLCHSPGPEGADGECRACAAFQRGNSADYLHVAPQGPSRLIRNDQIVPMTGKEEFVPVTTFFRTAPLMSRHRVVVIEDAHRMNEQASNGLLKTLEEPQPYARLILTTDSVGGVLPTILSRCLTVACELPDPQELREIAPDLEPDLLRLTDGAPGRLQRARENPDTYRRVAAFARKLATSPPGAALVLSDEFREIGEGVASVGGLGARAGNALALELLATYLAREAGAPARWTQEIVAAHQRIQGNGQPQIVYDALFASILGGE